MATTFLDVGLIKSIEVIFPFILTWVVVFGILEKAQIFGEKKGLHSIIAFVFAVLVIISPAVTGIIRIMAPWFLVIIMLIFFSLLLFKMFGLPDDVLKDLISGKHGNEQLIYWIIVISAIIFLAALGSVFFAQPLPNADAAAKAIGDGQGVGSVGAGAFFQTMFHPKVLGMVFIMVIATFTIILLAGKPK